jgi:CBS domain-containing protein
MKLKEIMTREVEVIHPDDSLQAAARKMKTKDIGFLPVCDGERLVGVVSDRDITVRATAEGVDPKAAPVRDSTTTELVYCFDDQGVDEAAQLMKDKQIRRLMVLNRDKRLVGVVSLGDLATNGNKKLSEQVLESVSTPAETH